MSIVWGKTFIVIKLHQNKTASLITFSWTLSNDLTFGTVDLIACSLLRKALFSSLILFITAFLYVKLRLVGPPPFPLFNPFWLVYKLVHCKLYAYSKDVFKTVIHLLVLILNLFSSILYVSNVQPSSTYLLCLMRWNSYCISYRTF